MPAGPRPHPTASTWADRTGRCWTTLDTSAGVFLVRVHGVLGRAAVQPCRAAADAAIALGCRELVLALDRLGPLDPLTVTVLGALRRYLHVRGVVLVLAGASPELRMALRSCGVLHRYGLEPTAAVALAHRTTDAAVRERRP